MVLELLVGAAVGLMVLELLVGALVGEADGCTKGSVGAGVGTGVHVQTASAGVHRLFLISLEEVGLYMHSPFA